VRKIKNKQERKEFVGQYEQTLRRWAPGVGLDPDLCVWVQNVLNPMNFPWRDLQNMKSRVQDYIETMGNAPGSNNTKNTTK